MMYEFRDVNETRDDVELPSEALNFDGNFFEVEVKGYRTLYVKGRESMLSEISVASKSRNGAYYQRKRYPERYITVGFLLEAEDSETFRESFNRLNELLDVEEKRLIFNDEPDKFFIGTPQGIGEIPTGRNHVTAEITFVCSDPFKYSVEEKEITAGVNAVTQVMYEGTFPSFPTVESSYDEDTVWISYNLNNAEIVLGDSAVGESGGTTEKLVSVSSDDANPLSGVTINGANTVGQDSFYAQSGSLRKYTGLHGDHTLISPNNWGTGTNWHGPSMTFDLGENCKNFKFKVNIWMHMTDNKVDEIGTMKILCSDASGNNLCGSILRKSEEGTFLGKRMEILQGTTVPESISKRTPIICKRGYKAGNLGANWVDVSTNAAITIEKHGGKITFTYPTNGGFTYKQSYKEESYESLSCRYVTIYMSKKEGYTSMAYMGVRQVNFWHLPGDEEESERNMFYSGDVSICDVASGAVEVNGENSPQFGAITNSWESFKLEKGRNYFAVFSDQTPTVKLRYREVYG